MTYGRTRCLHTSIVTKSVRRLVHEFSQKVKFVLGFSLCAVGFMIAYVRSHCFYMYIARLATASSNIILQCRSLLCKRWYAGHKILNKALEDTHFLYQALAVLRFFVS